VRRGAGSGYTWVKHRQRADGGLGNVKTDGSGSAAVKITGEWGFLRDGGCMVSTISYCPVMNQLKHLNSHLPFSSSVRASYAPPHSALSIPAPCPHTLRCLFLPPSSQTLATPLPLRRVRSHPLHFASHSTPKPPADSQLPCRLQHLPLRPLLDHRPLRRRPRGRR
jgi:hypothetical protein